jgi:hypothetical protein
MRAVQRNTVGIGDTEFIAHQVLLTGELLIEPIEPFAAIAASRVPQ